jgi:hypothetical protein
MEKDSAAVRDCEQHKASPTSRIGEVHLECGQCTELGCRFHRQGFRCSDDLQWARLPARDVEGLRLGWLCGCGKLSQ